MSSQNIEGYPVHIVEVSDEAHNYQFQLRENNLQAIISKIPDDMKVSVVSVVGAFRTGKSFLLTFMLRFLRHALGEDDEEVSEEWMVAEGEIMEEGNFNLVNARDAAITIEQVKQDIPKFSRTVSSFGWKGGHQRQTTGIWMWSEPFFRTIANGEKVAILLVDTQGMFDNETSMGLTACIFGLSTLISSHQIYNVDKRIQEDNLQQLALFAEYGRMALKNQANKAPTLSSTPMARLHKAAVAKQQEMEESNSEIPNGKLHSNAENSELESNSDVEVVDNIIDETLEMEDENKPFQRLEFLVRDWQNFEDEENMHAMLREMDQYIQGVIFDEKQVEDLKATREQILDCYENISCFTLPFPGREVTKKTYDGDVRKIDPLFKTLLNRYVRTVFGSMLEPKRMNGRTLTAPELENFIQAYVKLFQDGANFPTAKTMLEATAEANNANAKHLSLSAYKREMDKKAGPNVQRYVDAKDLRDHHEIAADGALAMYKGLANMGRKTAIKETLRELQEDIQSEFERYAKMNAQRNPWHNIEYYVVPILLAAFAFIMQWVADLSCSGWSDTCKQGSHMLGHVYVTIFAFMVIMSFGKISQLIQHMRNIIKLMAGGTGTVGASPSASKLKQL
mmetsp:Transcript_38518/g.49085  ORF Transcript_38518/g.49085 Transcript_38518/m.49085 type:complete len:622 (+) Transcript_38518:85-1950(+)